MKFMRGVLCAALIALLPASSFAATDTIARGLAAAGLAKSSTASPGRVTLGTDVLPNKVPVCNGVSLDQNVTNAGYASNSRYVMDCPNGFSQIQFAMPGFTNLTTTQTALQYPKPFNASIEVGVPPIWNSTTAYSTGALVSWATPSFTGTSLYWVAVAGSTGQMPSLYATSSYWVPATTANATLPPIYQITCNGSRTCEASTIVDPNGTVGLPALTWTDPVNGASCSSSCLIAFRVFEPSLGTADTSVTYASREQSPYWAPMFKKNNSSIVDQTLLNTLTAGYIAQGSFGTVAPIEAVGIPASGNLSKRTFCILGDSRAFGALGGYTSNVTATPVNTSSTGYVNNDIGQLLTVQTTGASSGGVSTPAKVMIMSVSGGVPTNYIVVDQGLFADTINQAQTDPNVTQNLTGTTTGTGAAVTLAYNGPTIDPGDLLTGAKGYLERGIVSAGYAAHNFATSGDTAAAFIAAPDARLEYIRQSGCSDVIDEFGINDINNNASLDTAVEGFNVQIANMILSKTNVKRIWLDTLWPFTASTDGFVLLANESPKNSTYNTRRASYNTWVRSLTASTVLSGLTGSGSIFNGTKSPFYGWIDTDSVVENNPVAGDGKWVVNGTACYQTCDGLHPTAGFAGSTIAPYITTGGGKIIFTN